MANEFYQYNGQIYQYKTNQQGKEKKASETKIILLAVTVYADSEASCLSVTEV